MKIPSVLAGFGLAAVLLSLLPFALRFAAAAPDNTLGMALLSATVRNDGAVLASSGVVSATNVKTGTGQYSIAFDRDLAACTCTATIGARNVVINPGTTSISANCPAGPVEPKFVGVRTNSDGAASDAPFQLIVFCPK